VTCVYYLGIGMNSQAVATLSNICQVNYVLSLVKILILLLVSLLLLNSCKIFQYQLQAVSYAAIPQGAILSIVFCLSIPL